MRAQGLRPRGIGASLAIATCSVLPSEHVEVVGTPEQTLFRGSIPGPHFPLSTLRPQPYDRKRMTRGRCDSLHLHRMKLSFTTFRRFYRRTNVRVNLLNPNGLPSVSGLPSVVLLTSDLCLSWIVWGAKRTDAEHRECGAQFGKNECFHFCGKQPRHPNDPVFVL
jgi:hypothetical protein